MSTIFTSTSHELYKTKL